MLLMYTVTFPPGLKTWNDVPTSIDVTWDLFADNWQCYIVTGAHVNNAYES